MTDPRVVVGSKWICRTGFNNDVLELLAIADLRGARPLDDFIREFERVDSS